MIDRRVELTAKLAQRYVAGNKIDKSDLEGVIRSIYTALVSVGSSAAPGGAVGVKPSAAEIRESVTPDSLISFIDGKPYKTLKRHLTANGHTIASYKASFGLPADYPVTAPNYSAVRSALARGVGLGSSRGTVKPRGPGLRGDASQIID